MLLIGWAFWSLLWPFNLLDSHEGAWNITNPGKVVHYGETAMIQWRGCRHTDLPAHIDTELRGNILLSLPPRVSTTVPGCQTVGFPIVHVGPEIPPGRYHARVIITFRVNPLRDVQYVYETDVFTVASTLQ